MLKRVSQYYWFHKSTDEGWEVLIAKLAKQATKAVIHKDQQSKQTANVVTKTVIHKDKQSRQLQIWW